MSVTPVIAVASSFVDVFAASDPQLKALAGNGNAKAVVEVADRRHAEWEKTQAPAPEVSASHSIQADAAHKLDEYA
jgi:hypothetical protein